MNSRPRKPQYQREIGPGKHPITNSRSSRCRADEAPLRRPRLQFQEVHRRILPAVTAQTRLRLARPAFVCLRSAGRSRSTPPRHLRARVRSLRSLQVAARRYRWHVRYTSTFAPMSASHGRAPSHRGATVAPAQPPVAGTCSVSLHKCPGLPRLHRGKMVRGRLSPRPALSGRAAPRLSAGAFDGWSNACALDKAWGS